jgi:hypothetical protein
MHVGVKEAIAHGVAQERAEHRQAERRSVKAFSPQGVAMRYRCAVDPLDCQDAFSGAAPIDVRNAEAFVILGVACHLGHRRGFEPQVHLEVRRVLQVVDDGDGLQAARRRIEAFDQTRCEVVAVEIAVEALFDIRTEDFDGDGLLDAAFENVGLVHLCD